MAPTFHLSRITFRLRLAFLGRPDMVIVDNYHSLFTFSSSSWVVLIWLVSLPLQSLRSLTGKTTDSSPGCCCGRYRFLTNKTTASVVDGCQSCFAFGLHSWAVLTWAVSLSLQSLRSLTGKTTDSSPSCCCGRYRFLTSKTTASVVDGCQSCFALGLHSWAVLTWVVPVAVAVAIAPLPARRPPQYGGFGGTCQRVGLFVFRSLSFSCMPGLLPRSPGCTIRRRRVSV